MKVEDIIEKFTINPLKDIEPNLHLTQELDVDSHKVEGCYNCGDKPNNTILPSTPWTIVQNCWACKHINVVYVQDRMGGVHTDTIKCFTSK